MFQDVFPFTVYCLLKSCTIFVKLKQFKHQQVVKMNDQAPKEQLDTSMLNYTFLKIYLYEPTSEFQKLEIGSHLAFKQNEKTMRVYYRGVVHSVNRRILFLRNRKPLLFSAKNRHRPTGRTIILITDLLTAHSKLFAIC